MDPLVTINLRSYYKNISLNQNERRLITPYQRDRIDSWNITTQFQLTNQVHLIRKTKSHLISKGIFLYCLLCPLSKMIRNHDYILSYIITNYDRRARERTKNWKLYTWKDDRRRDFWQGETREPHINQLESGYQDTGEIKNN